MSAKIAFIGAGSVEFTKNLLGDILSFPELADATIALHDIDQERLDAIGVELDQCYDLLRQRQARREFGQDPDEAQLRPPEIVERYQQ